MPTMLVSSSSHRLPSLRATRKKTSHIYISLTLPRPSDSSLLLAPAGPFEWTVFRLEGWKGGGREEQKLEGEALEWPSQLKTIPSATDNLFDQNTTLIVHRLTEDITLHQAYSNMQGKQTCSRPQATTCSLKHVEYLVQCHLSRWLQRTRFSGGLELQEGQLAYLVTINELVSRNVLRTQISTLYGTVLHKLTSSTETAFCLAFKFTRDSFRRSSSTSVKGHSDSYADSWDKRHQEMTASFLCTKCMNEKRAWYYTTNNATSITWLP